MSELFPSGGGEMASLLRCHDWSAHALGAPGDWPDALKTELRLILDTRYPAYILWAGPGYCFYNDGFRASLGAERHPASIGRPARTVWRDGWAVVGSHFAHVMDGHGATWHENQLVPLLRNGKIEDVYWTWSHSPISDATAPNGIGGVLVVCSETTEKVLAQGQLRMERERQRLMLQQMPGFAALLSGSEHRHDYVNAAYIALSGEREFIGLPVRTVFPELADQGFFATLDRVYSTGEPIVTTAMAIRFDRPDGERFVDCSYEHVRDDAGRVTGIYVGGARALCRPSDLGSSASARADETEMAPHRSGCVVSPVRGV